jgi:hypothetical protein
MVLVYVAKVQASISKNAASRASGAILKNLPQTKEPFFFLQKWALEPARWIFY